MVTKTQMFISMIILVSVLSVGANLAAKTPVPVHEIKDPQLFEMKADLDSLLSMYHKVQGGPTLSEHVNLIKKTSEWLIKYRTVISLSKQEVLQKCFLNNNRRSDDQFVQALIKLARKEKPFSLYDVCFIVSLRLDKQLSEAQAQSLNTQLGFQHKGSSDGDTVTLSNPQFDA